LDIEATNVDGDELSSEVQISYGLWRYQPLDSSILKATNDNDNYYAATASGGASVRNYQSSKDEYCSFYPSGSNTYYELKMNMPRIFLSLSLFTCLLANSVLWYSTFAHSVTSELWMVGIICSICSSLFSVVGTITFHLYSGICNTYECNFSKGGWLQVISALTMALCGAFMKEQFKSLRGDGMRSLKARKNKIFGGFDDSSFDDSIVGDDETVDTTRKY